MKLLIINTVAFELNGITSVIMNYYRIMNKDDMKIDFVVINNINDEYQKELESNNSDIYYIQRNKNPLKYIIELNKLIRKNKYDIVHIHGNSATMSLETFVAFGARVPVRIIHSHNTTCKHKILHKVLYPILKSTYTHGFACGKDAGKWLFKNNKFEVIKNGINLNDFKFSQIERKMYREKINAGNLKVIGHVANFVHQKNHEFLIELFSEVLKLDKNYLLLLIGEGQLLEAMKEKVRSEGIENNVIFLGKSQEVSAYLQSMDIFVLPSHYEGLPVVLIEAQALGVPCLVSDKVSREAKLTDLIEFLSIDNMEVWINKIKKIRIYDRVKSTRITHKEIDKAGYNVSKNAYIMKNLYKQYLKEKR